MNNPKPELSITAVKIQGLFGYLTHEIELNKDHAVFIHGPNGCGKTTTLYLIYAFLGFRFDILHETRFDSISISFDDGTMLIVRKVKLSKKSQLPLRFNEDDDINDRAALELAKDTPSLRFEFIRNNKFEDSVELPWSKSRPDPQEISRYYPFLRRVAPREWRNIATGERIRYSDIIERYRIPIAAFDIDLPEWLTVRLNATSVRFIRTQRLFELTEFSLTPFENEDSTELPKISPIQYCSNEIKKMISIKRTEQSDISQSSDSTFPERLLNIDPEFVPNESDVRSGFEDNEKKIQDLVEAGLIAEQGVIKLPKSNLSPTQLQVINLYLDDMNKKLEVFDDLHIKIKTFLGIISDKFKNKKIFITRQDGIKVILKNDLGDLELDELSSGEQHQIVLFFELIFLTTEKTLFLVDEPEISLHADWQRSFVDDLESVKTLGHCQFLIATHSPQIIGNHIDWAQALDGGIL